jgi:hypothetical protein
MQELNAMRPGARLLRLQYIADVPRFSSDALDSYVIHLGHAADCASSSSSGGISSSAEPVELPAVYEVSCSASPVDSLRAGAKCVQQHNARCISVMPADFCCLACCSD